ncbi:hypothetical protein KSF78_0007356 [Schistosoma japonicum]|nr:hypothetical protein KSF78_0007356 [Schistosoma japonicum]KAH8860954.1 hypothetical protein KSF78_0007356 [Schistosoma japonicum]KAH8860955.1 hypothetical protein KSF78_0007356 [Schistosoma japonicum]KAH8860960.1 hypothetical protein KSF78_0007356 [Schistosoma japonicum]
MTRSNYYDEVSYLMTKIHDCREKRMGLMKEYAIIQHNGSYGNGSISNHVVQYNINLERLKKNIRKVEKRHETLKYQFEEMKQNANDISTYRVNKRHNSSSNNQEVFSLEVAPSLLSLNNKNIPHVDRSSKNILESKFNIQEKPIHQKFIFADRHRDKVWTNRAENVRDSNSKLQQVIKRTKEILDAQEITLKSISFNNNDDENDCVITVDNMNHKELSNRMTINKEEDNEEKGEEEIIQRKRIDKVVVDETSNHSIQQIVSPTLLLNDMTYSNHLSDAYCKQQSKFFSSNSILNNDHNDMNLDENNSEQMIIKSDTEHEDEQEEVKKENVNVTVPSVKETNQLGQSYEEFLTKATFSVEDSSNDIIVNVSNEHASEYDSAILASNININDGIRTSYKLLDSTNVNLLSSWTTYKTEDLEDDSFYD